MSSLESILNGGMNIVADGSYLKDINGKIVGTLNEDGSYSLLSAPLSSQVSESHESLLQNFENQMACESVSFTDTPVKYEIMDTVISNPIQPIKPSNAATSLLRAAVTESIARRESLKGLDTVSRNTESQLKKEVSAAEAMASGITPKLQIKETKHEPITISTPVVKKETNAAKPANQNKPAPLGSSANPIRIIQQGNSYTSTQELTKDQLAQIMQVVQQQQALKEAQEAGGQKVIYNPQTQTKIVYKVVNPVPESTSKKNLVSSLLVPKPGRKRGRPKNSGSDDDEYKLNGPELSRREKEEKKKKRPRTRSGRVSKPPRHMIDDYKHIHLVDWQEDYDDSDGGYSDYKGETDEEEKQAKKIRLEEEARQMQEKSMANTKRKIESKREEGTTQGQEGKNESTENGDDKPVQQSKKAPWNRNSKRYKLKEMMSRCPDEVLLDVMLPKLCNMVSVWEFLLMKIEDEHPDTDVTFPMIYREYETLRTKVKQAFDENMKEKLLEKVDDDAAGDAVSTASKFSIFSIRREDSARSLGAQMGIYRVVDRGPNKPDYMFLTSKVTPQTQALNSKSNNRQVALVKEDQVKMPVTGNMKPDFQTSASKAPLSRPDNTTPKPPIIRAPINKAEHKIVNAKSENKIEVVSVPKEKLQSGSDKNIKTFGEIKREIDLKKTEIKSLDDKSEKLSVIKKSSNGSLNTQPEKDRISPFSNVDKKQHSTINSSDMKSTNNDGKVLEIPNSKQLTQNRGSKPKDSMTQEYEQHKSLSLPVPSRGSVVLTSSSDLVEKKEDDEKKIAKALATSVISRKAENATGVVSDMSDLDVWESSSDKVASTTSALSTTSTGSASPATTASSLSSHKMVSIVGIRPEDKTVQFAENKDTTMEAEARKNEHSESTTKRTALEIPQSEKIQTIVSESGEEMQIPEGVQMVIQHPDGSYQLIENADEAAELMRQAELAEKQGSGQVSNNTVQQQGIPDGSKTQAEASTALMTKSSGVAMETEAGREMYSHASDMEQTSHVADMMQSQTSHSTLQGDMLPGMIENSDATGQKDVAELQQPSEQPVNTQGQLLQETNETITQMSNQSLSQDQHILGQSGEEVSNQVMHGGENFQAEGNLADVQNTAEMMTDSTQSLMQHENGVSEFGGDGVQMPQAPGNTDHQLVGAEQMQQMAGGSQELEAGQQEQLASNADMAMPLMTTSGDEQIHGIQSIDTSAPIATSANPTTQDSLEAAAQPDATTQNIDPNAQTLIFQTDDGLILIRQPDGNFQVQSTTGAPINMDTVRALINSLQLM